jgi:hypothetical protein
MRGWVVSSLFRAPILGLVHGGRSAGLGTSVAKQSHVEIAACAPLGAGHASEPCRDQHEGRVAVRERADDASAPSHLANDALERIVGADASPMLGRTQGVNASKRRTG